MTEIRSGESTWQQRIPGALQRGLYSFVLAASLLDVGFPTSRANAAETSGDLGAQEKDECTKNLKLIYDAIEAYRKEHKDLPNWLSDLVPDYLTDANLLVCPVCRRTGQIEKPPLADPRIASSYLFEFCPAQLGNSAPGNPTATRRNWKERQMAIVGSIVPIVRCRHHKSALNVAFDGRIYESPPSWETMLTNTVDPKSLTSAQIFAAVASSTNSSSAKKASPSRDRKAAPQVSDVSQSVRVTTLDLVSTDPSGKSFDETAQKLKSQTPDVILLRGVAGWKIAAQLAKALEPARYHVVACSAFGINSKSSRNQVAILARKMAYFSWSEPWKSDVDTSADGGFTFAAIEIAGHRFGFLTLNTFGRDELPGISIPQQTEVVAHQLLESVQSYRGWSNNRLEGFIVATFRPISNEGETGRMLRSAGFRDPTSDPSISPASDLMESHLLPNSDSPKGLLLSKALTCEFDFQTPPVVVIVTNAPMVQPQMPGLSTHEIATAPSIQSGIWWIFAGLGLMLLVVVAILLSIRHRLNRWQAQNALVPVGSYNVVMASPTSATTTALSEGSLGVVRSPNLTAVSPPHGQMSQHGLLEHFSQWLKQAFVQRLVSDRQKLLDDQHVAARKVSSVDERLARLETKIQQQTAAYEKEIELLNQKLLTAREENLELIRSQIKFLKSEMEATRARVLESEQP